MTENLIEKNLLSALLEYIRNAVSYETVSLNDERIKDLIDEVVDDEYLKKCDLSESIDDILHDNSFVTNHELESAIGDYLYTENYWTEDDIKDYVADEMYGYVKEDELDDYLYKEGYVTEIGMREYVDESINDKLNDAINKVLHGFVLRITLLEIENKFLKLRSEYEQIR